MIETDFRRFRTWHGSLFASNAFRVAVAVALAWGVVACGAESNPGDEGSESHWLTACDTDAQCEEGSCLCGTCTVACTTVLDCPEPLDVCTRDWDEPPLLGCTSDVSAVCSVSDPSLLDGKPNVSTPDQPVEPGTIVDVDVSTGALDTVNQSLSTAEGWGASELLDAYPVAFEDDLGFDPTTALNFDLLQGSAFALTPSELDAYQSNGIVLKDAMRFPTFSYGYFNVYAQDLPVFVTADSVLDALHRSYDDILKELELEVLVPTFANFLQGMREQSAASSLPDAMRGDVDFFLAVSQSLLQGQPMPPSFEGAFDPEELGQFVSDATQAQGIESRELFGVVREIDFSQFKPRGHYTDDEVLSRYFRAMMWMGRIDLRLIETLGDGARVFHRRQAEAMFALEELMAPELRAEWDKVDKTVTAFVGEHDYMNIAEIDSLKDALGVTDVAGLAEVSDEQFAQVILDCAYGEQRIASHVMRKSDPFAPTLPLNVSFALFGQRYVLDSHVFSQVVFDRVPDRAVPNPLDAAFAALGNNQAAHLLSEELQTYTFAANLGAMRIVADAHPQSSWESSLYTLWLGALRELSAKDMPAGSSAAAEADVVSETGSGLPQVAKTEAWGRRLLNTQLGSWSQLRHDTLLYAKQSYTTSSECRFPDAYVEPYPAFWAKLLSFAERGAELVTDLDLPESTVIQRAQEYFQRFSSIVGVLHRMSEAQLTGNPHSDEDVMFINDAVRISGGGSGPPTIEGWYHQLLFHPEAFSVADLIVADVHTDPGGDVPPRGPSVLHVGTGYPRLMVTAIDTCDGPRVYAGPVYAYKEYLASGVVRLNDEDWAELLRTEQAPPEPAWLQPVSVKQD